MFDVTIDFDTSHLLFPTITAIVAAILLIAILITRRQAIMAAISTGPYWPAGIDHRRFFGTLVITVIYFLAMPAVGDVFPNTGLGFYFCSIPYLFVMGVLYLHRLGRRDLMFVGLNAIIAPTIVWFLLSEVFNITLP